MYRTQDDIAQNAMTLLSLTNSLTLMRHQWLIDQVRCILTGEVAKPVEPLTRYEEIDPLDLNLPDNLTKLFIHTKSELDSLWHKTVKASHPASGFTVFEQIAHFQTAAKTYMQASKDANITLWKEVAMRDAMTGAWSRLTLTQSLNEAIEQFNSMKKPCVIALIDHDNFKEINDDFGHIIGDEVLTKTSAIIHQSLRPHDQLYRYGGDEWLIMMPNTNKILASAIMNRVAQNIKNHLFYSQNQMSFNTTFSYGLAEVEDDLTPQKWINNADFQLYAKKLKIKMSHQVDKADSQQQVAEVQKL